MKLRWEPVVVALAAAAVWLVLDARRVPSRAAIAPVAPEEPAAARVELAQPLGGPPAPEGPRATRQDARAEPEPVAAATSAQRAGISRGRLVDARTREPIPDALVTTGTGNDWTDASGWFDTGESLDALAEVQVLNVAPNTNSHEIARERWTRIRDAWEVPVEIGPTYRIRLVGVEQQPGDDWEGRLVHEGKTPGPWLTLRKGPPAYLRYDEPVHAAHRDDRSWVEVRSKDGLLEGRAEASATSGIHDVEIACRTRAVLRGRVVDELGRSWSAVDVDAVQVSNEMLERLEGFTDADGRYQLSAGLPGTMQVLFGFPPPFEQDRRIELAVGSGVTDAGDLVVPRFESVGSIAGSVESRSGNELPGALVRLRPLDRPGKAETRVVKMSKRILTFLGGEDVHRTGFRAVTSASQPFVFENVPPGRYEVSVFTGERFRTSPPFLQVRAPAVGLVFTIEDTVGPSLNLVEVLDAERRTVLDRMEVTFRIEGGPIEVAAEANWNMRSIELVPGTAFEWFATAPGYRAARGTERDFRLRDDLPVTKSFPVATCALRRGFGAQLLVQDWSDGGGLARVTILADGASAATTDETGMALLDLEAVPAKIDVRLPGWRVLDPSWSSRDALIYPPTRVLMVRD